MSKGRVREGMSFALWERVDPDATGHRRTSAHVPEAVDEAADALGDLYVDMNNADLASLTRRLVMAEPMTDFDLGRAMADAAIGDARAAHVVKGVMQVPTFRIDLEGDDLVWEGDAVTANPADWPASEVQSLLFDTELYSETRARAWAKEHGFKYGSIETTGRYHHLRQFEPGGRQCRTITFGTSGIKAVVCSTKSNPVGDEVDVVSGPGRGMRGRVQSETDRTAQILFESGRRGHVERSALRPRRGR